MPPIPDSILLGTVAIEPNRWGTLDPSRAPRTQLADWLPAIAGAGFDGLEVWEEHLTAAEDGGDALLSGMLPISVLNTYESLDDPDPIGRRTVADWVRRSGASAVKFNVGNDAGSAELYAERITEWLGDLPSDASLLCECHAGISIAEDPQVAARIFEAAGPVDRLGAIVHTHETPDHLRARFDAYGDRIRHVHVNYLDVADRSVPLLADRRDDLAATVDLLRSLGFRGTWTIEFVDGILSDRDLPELLVPQAIEDLGVLRSVLG